MNSDRRTSRLLGAAFLLQAVTSLGSAMILALALMVPGDISETMVRIANQPWLMRADILGETITSMGVIFLAAMLFVTLRRDNETMALVALGLYILETTLGAGRIEAASSLLRISQEYVATGHPAHLQTMGKLASDSMDSGLNLLMLPFCAGAILFYYLLYKSGLVPRALSLWGLIAVVVALVGTLLTLSGYKVPFLVYLPYAPFEFTVGVWILVKGVKESV